MDSQEGPAHTDGRDIHVYVRSAISGDTAGEVGQLDVANKVSAAERFRGLRMSSEYGTEDVAALSAECSG